MNHKKNIKIMRHHEAHGKRTQAPRQHTKNDWLLVCCLGICFALIYMQVTRPSMMKCLNPSANS